MPQMPALLPSALHPLSISAVVHTMERATDRSRPPVWRRSGAYERFLAHVLEELPRRTLPDGPFAGTTPLERVNLESHDDLIVALIKSWATVGDVLSFYQERIANEGYLRTAVEERSVFELARLVGYNPDPGLAAVTYLAFTVAESRGISPDFVVPPGTRAMNVPSQGDRPQPFETTAPLAVRAEWNAMPAAPPEQLVRQRVDARTRELALDGVDTRVIPHQPLLIADGELGTEAAPGLWRTVTVRSVEVDPPSTPLLDLPGISPRTAQMLSRRVHSAGRGANRRNTHVAWDPPSTPLPAGVIADPAVYAFREQARLFGWDAESWSDLSEKERERHVAQVPGLAASSDGGRGWQSPKEGLAKGQIQAVAVDGAGTIYLGTDQRGIYRSLDGGVTWLEARAGLTRRDVRSFAVDANGHVYAGAVGGVFRSLDGGASWDPIQGDQRLRLGRHGVGLANTKLPSLGIRSVAAYRHGRDRRTYVFAGTDTGLLRSHGGRDGWEPCNNGLPQVSGEHVSAAVNAIAAHEDSEHVYLGTDRGVYYSRDAGHQWIPVNEGLPTVDGPDGDAPAEVTALIAYTDQYGSDTYILAATEQGLFRAIDPDTSWTQVASARFGPGHAQVTCLAVWFDDVAHNTVVLAGTDQGLFASLDHGDTWRPMGDPVSGPVRALAAGGRRIAAAVPPRWPSNDEWPGFGIVGDEIDLDDTYLSVTAGGWLLLQQPRARGAPLEGLYPVLEARRVLRRDFGRRRVVTRVITRPDDLLKTFDRRRTLVFAKPQRLPLAQTADPSLTGRNITLAGTLTRGLESGRVVIVGGKRIRAKVVKRGGTLTLRDADGRPRVELGNDERPIVLGPPEELPDGTSRWPLRHVGVEGWATAAAGELVPQLAADDDPTVQELARVFATTPDDGAGRARLVLADPLANVYDGHTVVVRANVARATHGETIGAEVLGSGDYQQINQRFPLRRAPLTWLPDPETGEATCSLTVYVNRVRWRRVESLHESGPEDHCYTLETDENGISYVVFGDGVMGARLPSGFENVVASYRSGLGAEGEVRAESIVQLMSRPLGLRSVTNPLPATGAGSPEGPEQIRRRAPLRARALHRIVSRADYVDFCRNYPGVAKVDAQVLWDGRHRFIHVSIAAAEGAKDDEGVRAGLVAAIAGAQAGAHPVLVEPCERLAFEVDATIRLEPGRLTEGVEEEALAALSAAFGFQQRHLGQPLAASDVVALLQGLPGVAGVDLERLALLGGPGGPLPAFLRAQPGRWDREARVARPAQLLVIRPEGCRLTVVGEAP